MRLRRPCRCRGAVVFFSSSDAAPSSCDELWPCVDTKFALDDDDDDRKVYLPRSSLDALRNRSSSRSRHLLLAPPLARLAKLEAVAFSLPGPSLVASIIAMVKGSSSSSAPPLPWWPADHKPLNRGGLGDRGDEVTQTPSSNVGY